MYPPVFEILEATYIDNAVRQYLRCSPDTDDLSPQQLKQSKKQTTINCSVHIMKFQEKKQNRILYRKIPW